MSVEILDRVESNWKEVSIDRQSVTKYLILVNSLMVTNEKSLIKLVDIHYDYLTRFDWYRTVEFNTAVLDPRKRSVLIPHVRHLFNRHAAQR